MSIELSSNLPLDICVKDMNDGDLGVVTKWNNDWYIGKIVQRYNERFIVVGETSDNAYTSLLDSKNPENFRVRPLIKGETLTVK